MEKLYAEALRLLNNSEDFSLATIITRDGSAPRGPGTKMIIRKDGTIFGTIGGGLLEAEVMTGAANVLKNKKAEVKEFHLKAGDFASIDMTCGGDLEVLIDYIDASDPVNREIFGYIAAIINIKKSNSYLVTIIPSSDAEFPIRKQFIILADGSCIGKSPFNINELIPRLSSVGRYKVIHFKEKTRLIIESINISRCVNIFGAGHVGQKVAELLKFLGFYITVIDDREEFANTQRFPFADRIHIVKNFADNIDYLDIDQQSYIVIVTRGHVNDEAVLRLALKTKAGYIGMIGSKRKRNTIYSNLMKKEFTKQDLARVHAPIGLAISAETPEEIAVSIAAEIIKVNAGIPA